MSDHTPNPTDVVGTVDTTGINPGPHSTLEGVSPIFEMAKDSNETPIEEHFATMALAAGTEEYQDENPVNPEPHESQPFPPADETADTSDTGGRAPGDTINQDLPAMTSTDQVGAENTAGKSTSESADDGSKDVGEGPLEKRKVTQLQNLADREGVEVSGNKAEIVAALQKAKVPEDS